MHRLERHVSADEETQREREADAAALERERERAERAESHATSLHAMLQQTTASFQQELHRVRQLYADEERAVLAAQSDGVAQRQLVEEMMLQVGTWHRCLHAALLPPPASPVTPPPSQRPPPNRQT